MNHDPILPDKAGDEWLDRFTLDVHAIICRRQRGILAEDELLKFGLAIMRTELDKCEPKKCARIELTIADEILKKYHLDLREMLRRQEQSELAGEQAARIMPGA
jgi:hypothetical protein